MPVRVADQFNPIVRLRSSNTATLMVSLYAVVLPRIPQDPVRTNSSALGDNVESTPTSGSSSIVSARMLGASCADKA